MIDVDAHDFTQDAGVVRVAVTVPVGVDETWRRIGDFAGAGRFIGVTSVVVSGGGGMASIREVGDAVTEKMVAQGERFYVYVQTRGPMADFGYHGCLAVEGDAAQCIIFYTLAYDADAVDPALRESMHAGLVQRFDTPWRPWQTTCRANIARRPKDDPRQDPVGGGGHDGDRSASEVRTSAIPIDPCRR